MSQLPTQVIHKMKLSHSYRTVQLPCECAKALSVGVSQGVPCLWYARPYEPSQDGPFTARGEVTKPEPFKLTNVEVLCVFTGEEYRLETDGWRFLGTIVHNPTHYENIVIHVYVKGF